MATFKVEVKDIVVQTRVLYIEAETGEQAEAFAENPDLNAKETGSEYLSGEVQGAWQVHEVPRRWPFYKAPRK